MKKKTLHIYHLPSIAPRLYEIFGGDLNDVHMGGPIIDDSLGEGGELPFIVDSYRQQLKGPNPGEVVDSLSKSFSDFGNVKFSVSCTYPTKEFLEERGFSTLTALIKIGETQNQVAEKIRLMPRMLDDFKNKLANGDVNEIQPQDLSAFYFVAVHYSIAAGQRPYTKNNIYALLKEYAYSETSNLADAPILYTHWENFFEYCKQWNPFYIAAIGNVEKMKIMLKIAQTDQLRLFTVDSRDEYGWTCLHRAVFGKHIEMTQLLLTNGASVDILDKDSKSVFDKLRANPSPAIEQLLRNNRMQRGVQLKATKRESDNEKGLSSEQSNAEARSRTAGVLAKVTLDQINSVISQLSEEEAQNYIEGLLERLEEYKHRAVTQSGGAGVSPFFGRRSRGSE
jgi:hypothetical protein